MPPSLSLTSRFRTVLVLGRVSNLPTVWSNCLAAWLLGGGGPAKYFAQLLAGTTLLYTGGMYLNDAVDADFDRQHRAERPIPSGRISRRTVWLSATALLVFGWLLLAPFGAATAMFASVLLAAVVVYDAVHKRTSLAPLLMAACRFLLYLVAASAAVAFSRLSTFTPPAINSVAWPALALAAYITGLSYLARRESTSNSATLRWWPMALLFAPVLLAVARRVEGGPLRWMPLLAATAWIIWCLRHVVPKAKPDFGHCVAGLLAGIVLTDWLAAPIGGNAQDCAFGGLFVLSLLLQRVIPAT